METGLYLIHLNNDNFGNSPNREPNLTHNPLPTFIENINGIYSNNVFYIYNPVSVFLMYEVGSKSPKNITIGAFRGYFQLLEGTLTNFQP